MTKFELLTKENIPTVVNHMIDFYAIDGYPINQEKTTELFHQFINQPLYGSCFVIKAQEEICGYIIVIQFFSFEMSGMVMLLDELYVSNQFQGKGIGKKAMTFIKEYAHDKDFKKIVLEVEPHNERAIQLYEKEQFRKHRRDLMLFP